MHGKSHTVIRLAIHLPLENTICFVPNKEDVALENNPATTLTAWFELNKSDNEARKLTYSEIPDHYVFNEKKWSMRKQKSMDYIKYHIINFITKLLLILHNLGSVISRIYSVNIKSFEKYCLRLLLLRVKGAKSFEDIRIFKGITYETFEEAARAQKIIHSDEHIIKCLDEAVFLKLPRQLRILFATIIVYAKPSNIAGLFIKYQDNMIEDYILRYSNDIAKELLLHNIHEFLIAEGKTLAMYRLPNPKTLLELLPELTNNNTETMKGLSLQNQASFNNDQKKIFKEVNNAMYNNSKNKLFYLDGPGGSGKTFLYNTLIQYVLGNGDRIRIYIINRRNYLSFYF